MTKNFIVVSILIFCAIFFPLYISSCDNKSVKENCTYEYEVVPKLAEDPIVDSSKVFFLNKSIENELINVTLIYPTSDQNIKIGRALGCEHDAYGVKVKITKMEYFDFIAWKDAGQARRLVDIYGNVFPGENLMIKPEYALSRYNIK